MKKKLLVVLLGLFFLAGCATAPKALKLNKLGSDSVVPPGSTFAVQITTENNVKMEKELINKFEDYLKERLAKNGYGIDPNAPLIMKIGVKKWEEKKRGLPLGAGLEFLKVEYAGRVDVYKNDKLLGTGDIETNFSMTSNYRPVYVTGEYRVTTEGYLESSRRAFAELIVRGLKDLSTLPPTTAAF